jgi:hypothetical protein
MEDDTYCVKKSVREMITFAPQNLLQDRVGCRNSARCLHAAISYQPQPVSHLP